MKLISFRKPTKQLFSLITLLLLSGVFSDKVQAQEDGETLFNTYCVACHMTGDMQMVGPGLKGVEDRHSREWIYKWVKDSQAMVKAGDEDAVALFKKYNEVVMPPQPLNNEQIDAILNYVAISNGETPTSASSESTIDAAPSEEKPKKESEATTSEESTSPETTEETAEETSPAGGDIKNGEKLFKSYCAACHSAGNNKLVGPGLAGVSEKYDREWLYKWIKNSTELIESGDADAVAIYEEFNKMMMPAQPVNNQEIDDILAYIKDFNAAAEKEAVAGSSETAASGGDDQGVAGQKTDDGDSPYLILAIVIVLFIVILILRKVQHVMRMVNAKTKGEEPPKELSIGQAIGKVVLKNKTIFALMGIVVLVLIAKVGWNAALGVGVYTGYEPEQPIKFSHKLHAGQNGIDCNYCHNSASFSKSAGIPSANLCMNCHTYIQEGPQYGKEEIAKIYEALDFDPVTKTYGSNQKPIKWVKVHNLPDHVYFNHSQHVTVGKIACQECHGPVETYTVGKQYAPLTMGWCINCHRETKVQMADNGYYDEIHKRLPEELKEEYLKDGTITVSELGGIECVKCHY